MALVHQPHLPRLCQRTSITTSLAPSYISYQALNASFFETLFPWLGPAASLVEDQVQFRRALGIRFDTMSPCEYSCVLRSCWPFERRRTLFWKGVDSQDLRFCITCPLPARDLSTHTRTTCIFRMFAGATCQERHCLRIFESGRCTVYIQRKPHTSLSNPQVLRANPQYRLYLPH